MIAMTCRQVLNWALLLGAVIWVPRAANGQVSSAPQASVPVATIRDLSWDELAPANWDPIEEVQKALRKKQMSIFDVRATKELRQVWAEAPANKALNGAMVRLAGYVVPVERSDLGLTEFLLVAYFGACTQSQCPPANQAVHVFMAKPSEDLHTMDAATVYGRLQVKRTKSFRGTSSYNMKAIQADRTQNK